MQINLEFMSVPAECQQNFHLPEHILFISCNKLWQSLNPIFHIF